MGNRGRFGKYGDIKRVERLRKARIRPDDAQDRRSGPPRGVPGYGKKTLQKVRVIVRRAKASDGAYIRSLSKKVFEQYGDYEDTLPRWSLSGMTVTLLALKGKQAVGFAMLGGVPHEWCSPRISELLAIAVEPESQGQGIGDLLMKEIVREAKAHEIKTLGLHTAVENVAGQRLFEKHGFAESEIKKNFYSAGQDALAMYKDVL
jgi:ribosomal protein S18 acetylase RimI-like enzyme